VTRDPVPITQSLSAIIRSLRNETSDSASGSARASSQTATQMGGVFGRWAEAVGDAVALHVTPVKLDGSTLVVEVDDPAWATQLRFLETTLKQRLLEVAGATIDTVEVRVKRR
jgi:predicted nucleic acid-binding Zn ribbon protein